jgi:hypothetical protein
MEATANGPHSMSDISLFNRLSPDFPSLLRYFSPRHRRLLGSIVEFRSEIKELTDRAGSKEGVVLWAKHANEILSNAEEACNKYMIDDGWRLLHAAARTKVRIYEASEVQNEAIILRQEAEKLSSWRRKAVLNLIGNPDCPLLQEVSADQLYRAMLIRDEHYNNQAYKDGHLKSTILILVGILSLLLITLTSLYWSNFLPIIPPPLDPSRFEINLLIGVILFGLLGSTFSAMTKMAESQKPSRIPEQVGAARATFLRVFMGAASALILYIFIKSEVWSSLISFDLDLANHNAIFAVSFVSGFSERLVLKALEKVTGK